MNSEHFEDDKKETTHSFFKHKILSLSPSNQEKYSLLSQQISKHHEAYEKAKVIPKLPLIPMDENRKDYDEDNAYYPTHKEAKQYRCSIGDLAEWEPNGSEEGQAVTVLFVVDKNFSFYREVRKTQEGMTIIHHSTFLKGAPVKYAGELLYVPHPTKTKVLQLAGITNISGHYKPHRGTLLGLLLWLHHHKFSLKNMTVQAYGESAVPAIQYLIKESKELIEEILKLTKSTAFDLSQFVTLMQYLPDINFPLYSEDKKSHYKPLYLSQIFSKYYNRSNANDFAIFFLSHGTVDSCAIQAIRDLIKWLSVTDAPAKNYTFAIHLIRRNLATTLMNSGVLNLQGWLPILYQYGYDLNQYDDDGMTLLYNACRYNRTNHAELLLRYKAAVDQRNGLHYSRQYNLSNPYHIFEYTETPLDAAASNDHLAIVKMLVKAGAEQNYEKPLSRNKGLTLLQTAIEKSNHIELIKMMLEAIRERKQNDNINYFSEEGYTAFHYLFLPNNLFHSEKKEILKIIIKNCPKVDFSLKTKTSPMRSLKELAELYNGAAGLQILQELKIIDNNPPSRPGFFV